MWKPAMPVYNKMLLINYCMYLWLLLMSEGPNQITAEPYRKDPSSFGLPPVIVSEVKNYTVFTGQNVTMECLVMDMGNSLPNIQWLKHFQVNNSWRDEMNSPYLHLVQDSSNNDVKDPERYQLHNVTIEDSGWYTCIAANVHGKVYKSQWVQVQQKPSIGIHATDPHIFGFPPVIVSEVKNHSVFTGQNVMMECLVMDMSNSLPNIQWMKHVQVNNSWVDEKNSPNLHLLQDSSNDDVKDPERYQLHNVAIEDSGWYTCIAANVYGTVYKSQWVDVKQNPSIDQDPTDMPSFHFPPVIVSEVKNHSVFTGQNVMMECLVMSNSLPNIQWMKHFQVNNSWVDENNSPNLHLVQDSSNDDVKDPERYQLYNVTIEDSGWYTCIAANAYGRVYKSQWVEVKQSPSIDQDPTAVTQNCERAGRGVLRKGQHNHLLTFKSNVPDEKMALNVYPRNSLSHANNVLLTFKARDHSGGPGENTFSVVEFCFKVKGATAVVFQFLTNNEGQGKTIETESVSNPTKWTEICTKNTESTFVEFSVHAKKADISRLLKIRNTELVTCHFGKIESIIISRLQQWQSAYNAGDIKKVASLFAEDSVLMPDNQPTVRGKENIYAHLKKGFDAGTIGHLEGQMTEVFAISGEMAYSSTLGALYTVDRSKIKFRSAIVWKKVSEEWLIFRDMYNSLP